MTLSLRARRRSPLTLPSSSAQPQHHVPPKAQPGNAAVVSTRSISVEETRTRPSCPTEGPSSCMTTAMRAPLRMVSARSQDQSAAAGAVVASGTHLPLTGEPSSVVPLPSLPFSVRPYAYNFPFTVTHNSNSNKVPQTQLLAARGPTICTRPSWSPLALALRGECTMKGPQMAMGIFLSARRIRRRSIGPCQRKNTSAMQRSGSSSPR